MATIIENRDQHFITVTGEVTAEVTNGGNVQVITVGTVINQGGSGVAVEVGTGAPSGLRSQLTWYFDDSTSNPQSRWMYDPYDNVWNQVFVGPNL